MSYMKEMVNVKAWINLETAALYTDMLMIVCAIN